jgi:hypothetical protein
VPDGRLARQSAKDGAREIMQIRGRITFGSDETSGFLDLQERCVEACLVLTSEIVLGNSIHDLFIPSWLLRFAKPRSKKPGPRQSELSAFLVVWTSPLRRLALDDPEHSVDRRLGNNEMLSKTNGG